MKEGFIYILSNRNRNVLYVGVTAQIEKRILEHKQGESSGFTKRYNLCDLMYYERYPAIEQAIWREKQLKNWRQEWKWDLIKEANPDLKDLAAEWYK